ncbi:hypothetical protein OPQ81_004924 [Rhizoctonia solani]|nr:hypothetical protein OPQ81_004924 [Rhizoctonia solani]
MYYPQPGGYYSSPNGGYYPPPPSGPYSPPEAQCYPHPGVSQDLQVGNIHHSEDNSLKAHLARLRADILARAQYIRQNSDREVFYTDLRIQGTLQDVILACPPHEVRVRQAFEKIATKFQQRTTRVERNKLLIRIVRSVLMETGISLFFTATAGAGSMFGTDYGSTSIIDSFFQLLLC